MLQRRELSDVDGRWLLVHVPNAPLLCFEPEDQAAAECVRGRMRELRELWPRVREGKTREDLMDEVRELHRALVNDSIGITWPDCTLHGARYFYPWDDELPASQRCSLRKLVARLDRRRQPTAVPD